MKILNSNFCYKSNLGSSHITRPFFQSKILNADTVSFSSKAKAQNPKLEEITSDSQVCNEFITNVIQNPRNSQTTAKKLIDQAGSPQKFLNWYLKKGGYREKYSEYIKQAVESAKTPEELLKISPNWGFWVFENKFGSDFFIGEVPSNIGTKEDYQELTAKLLKGEETGYKVKEFSGGMSGKRAFLVDTGDHKYVLKTQQDYLMYSDKLRQAVEEDSWLKDTFIKNYKENEHMKSDSSYMNAMIDFYMNLNECPNALKIHCFDAKTSSVLYDFAQGESYSGDIDIRTVNNIMPDLKKLGVIYNDVSPNNLKEQNGELKIIDSGESSFVDILKPTVSGYQIEMPNWSGNNIITLLGSMNSL